VTPGFRTWLAELFAPLGHVAVRRVFGFHGLYLGECMFGLVADERIYLKTDEQNRKAYEREGSEPLSYAAHDGEHIITSYWEIPARLHDEPEELAEWARHAVAVAENSSTAKRRRARESRQRPARRPARMNKQS